MMITFNFHLPQEMHGDLQKAAHEQGRTAAEICRRALAAALEQHKRGGEYRIIPPRYPPRLEQGGAASAPAPGAPPEPPSHETLVAPVAAAVPVGGNHGQD
jgi:hypothetical protein